MLGAVTVTSDSLLPLMRQIAKKYNVDPALIRAIITVESNWDVNASRFEAHVNDSSWGLMQLLINTAKWMLGNDKLTISQLIQPETNIEAGTKYLAHLYNRYGNIGDTIAAYNAGSAKRDKTGAYINQPYVNKAYGYYVVYKTLESIATPTVASIGIGSMVAIGLVGLVLMMRR